MISVVVEDAFEQIKNIHYMRGLWTPMAQLQYRYQETLEIIAPSQAGTFNTLGDCKTPCQWIDFTPRLTNYDDTQFEESYKITLTI